MHIVPVVAHGSYPAFTLWKRPEVNSVTGSPRPPPTASVAASSIKPAVVFTGPLSPCQGTRLQTSSQGPLPPPMEAQAGKRPP